MPTAKEEARSVLDSLPDEATYEEIQYAIYVREKLNKAMAHADAGRVIDHEEVERRLIRHRLRR